MNLTPDHLLNAYCQGVFPMAEGRDGEIAWYSADPRAIQPFVQGDPLGRFHVRRSLAKQLRKGRFEVTTDRCFADVIRACATVPRGDDQGTWINAEIESLYTATHELGFAHSIEAWHDGELVGGIYGNAIGGAFFGESMFSKQPYASQACYVWLIEHLRERGYVLFDVQFTNPHLEQFGVVEVPGDAYLGMLHQAIELELIWNDDV